MEERMIVLIFVKLFISACGLMQYICSVSHISLKKTIRLGNCKPLSIAGLQKCWIWWVGMSRKTFKQGFSVLALLRRVWL